MAQNELCDRPVSLVDLYPTLLDMCGLPLSDSLDGQSLVPLLNNPNKKWERPVLTTFGYQNHAIRTDRWRYIRYNDGGEELYDHDSDPNEWKNLAANPEFSRVISKLKQSLPKENVK
ncbi:MAG: DUF4976 domain-containing protein [Opitutales bacterium]|nr:DUF4976 domain-containing protein [Opitutales bacterium]